MSEAQSTWWMSPAKAANWECSCDALMRISLPQASGRIFVGVLEPRYTPQTPHSICKLFQECGSGKTRRQFRSPTPPIQDLLTFEFSNSWVLFYQEAILGKGPKPRKFTESPLPWKSTQTIDLVNFRVGGGPNLPIPQVTRCLDNTAWWKTIFRSSRA